MAAEGEFEELLPVIVAELDDDGARATLEAVATAGGEICVPLTTAPVDGSRHVLEVYTPESGEPLLLAAYPLGPPTELGFLLRLEPMHPPSRERARPGPTGAPHPLRSRFPSASPPLTKGHAAALSAAGGAAPTSHVGRVLASGKLRLDGVIGEGGMGVVYRATHLGLNMPIAVKILRDSLQRDLDFCRRFHAEALAASRLDHANLTRVLDFGQEPDGLVYIAMEFLAGLDLRAVLGREKKLSSQRAARVLVQVTLGLTQMHTRGMVHRDLKPDNVVLVAGEDEDGKPAEVVKLCDFGIAIAHGASGEVVGTPDYMAPEQCEGLDLDARCDVYACGVMLYELVTGRVPFEGDPAFIVAQHMGALPQLAGIEPRVAVIIRKAMAKEVGERYQSARELRHALRGLLAATAPPPLPAAAKKAGVSQPDWLEGPQSNPRPYVAEAPSGQFTAVPVGGSPRVASAASHTLQTDPARFLTQLVNVTDRPKFEALCTDLEEMVPVLAARGQTATLWRIRSTLDLIAAEGPPLAGTRAASATRVLKQLTGDRVLAPAAEELLRAAAPSREARRLLLADAVAGTFALYEARVKAHASPEIRLRFVEALGECGATAWPLLRAALERLAKEGSEATWPVVEDLLAAVPASPDDAGGHAVTLHLRSPSASVRRVAIGAIARAWGARARPLFVAILQDGDDGVRRAVLAALRKLGPLDVEVVRRIAVLVEKDPSASAGLRAHALEALPSTAGAGRDAATTFLSAFTKRAPAKTPGDQDVLVAAAKALLSLDRAGGPLCVTARAAAEPQALRSRLLELARATR